MDTSPASALNVARGGIGARRRAGPAACGAPTRLCARRSTAGTSAAPWGSAASGADIATACAGFARGIAPLARWCLAALNARDSRPAVASQPQAKRRGVHRARAPHGARDTRRSAARARGERSASRELVDTWHDGWTTTLASRWSHVGRRQSKRPPLHAASALIPCVRNDMLVQRSTPCGRVAAAGAAAQQPPRSTAAAAPRHATALLHALRPMVARRRAACRRGVPPTPRAALDDEGTRA